MSKTTPVKKLVNGEIADADELNQIVENVGTEGGVIPYRTDNQEQDEYGQQSIGDTNHPFADVNLNQDGYLYEVDTNSPSVAASVQIKNLRKFIFLKDVYPTTNNSYAGHGGQFPRVRSTEDGLEFAAPSNVQVFTGNGNFDVPAGITTVYLTMVGGGGNGGAGGSGGGGGGGGGASVFNFPYTVTPLASISVTVGAAASASVFGTKSVPGGSTGVAGGSGGAGGAGGGGLDASTTTPGLASIKGGAGGNQSSNGGGGGGTPFGAGGAGGTGSGNGTAAAANSGAGGGGGGNSGGSGGAGGTGLVIVMW